MTKKKIFISFDYDHDKFLKEVLVGQAKNDDSPFEITDFSIKKEITEIIPSIVTKHIGSFNYSNGNKQFEIQEIFKSLRFLLNGHYKKYHFDENAINELLEESLTEEQFHSLLYSLNEKQSIRKAQGIYNTPNDVVDFIIANCISNNTKVYAKCAKLDDITLSDEFCNKTIFDPTVGSGEFLMKALQIKINHLKTNVIKTTNSDYINAISTIYGNDIDISAIEICKVRLFFEIAKWITIDKYVKVAEILNRNLTNYDFVNITPKLFKNRFDLIIGNPPYVEDSKSKIMPNNKFGNIYANVLKNSIELLNDKGKIAFIVPISYVATARMKKIRQYIEKNTNIQKIFNYADRPSCLFSGVHQKLSILIANKGDKKNKVYTSNYNYWYKQEREILFDDISIYHNETITENYYPKIGNKIEKDIYDKVHTTSEDNLLSYKMNKNNNVYINMRACFWIKAFSFLPPSSEFKGFDFGKNKWNILAVLNSSLFWWHWIAISDCWHITSKEIETFRVPKSILNSFELQKLAKKLEKELERTKVEINTKQATFEYKHKLCREIIDKIDDCLAEYYELSEKEIAYIKGFAKKYRESLGA